MVPSVVDARARGVLNSVRSFARLTETAAVWLDGTTTHVDAIICCTGFRPSLQHLSGLGVVEADGRAKVDGWQSIGEPRLWLIGYGDWCGAGSATLIGSSRVARDLAPQLRAFLEEKSAACME